MKKNKSCWPATLLTLLLINLMPTTAKANDKVLQVWQSDGKVMNIKLSEEPVTTYSDGNLIIKTTKTTVTFPLENVVRYTYSGGTVGISSPAAMSSEMSADGETLLFSGLKPGTDIFIYTASGQMARKVITSEQSQTAVTVSDLPTGVYVVKTNGITYKITKR